MAGQVRIYTQNNLQRNLAGPQYPDQIVLRGRDLDYFTRISPLIETMDELNDYADELVIEREYFSLPWDLIVDLLFPYELPEQHMPSHELFLFRDNGNPYLNPNRDVTIEDLHRIIDYFMIGNPSEMDEILMRFVYMRPGAPERPSNAHFTTSPASELQARRAFAARMRNIPHNNYNWGPENNEYNWPNNSENEGPEIGYTEEEEEALGRLQGTNIQRYFRGGRTRRRSRKLNKKTRKH